MAVKSGFLLKVALVVALLVFQDAAYARKLTEANGAPGLKEEKVVAAGGTNLNGGGYIGGGGDGYIGGGGGYIGGGGGGYIGGGGGGYGGGFFPRYGFIIPGFGPIYFGGYGYGSQGNGQSFYPPGFGTGY